MCTATDTSQLVKLPVHTPHTETRGDTQQHWIALGWREKRQHSIPIQRVQVQVHQGFAFGWEKHQTGQLACNQHLYRWYLMPFEQHLFCERNYFTHTQYIHYKYVTMISCSMLSGPSVVQFSENEGPCG